MRHAALVLAALALAACQRPPGEPPMSGYVEAELVYVAAGAAGTLQGVAVQRGQRVQRGQPLFTLDAAPETLGREAAAARSEAAAAMAQNLRKGRRPLELKAIDAQLAQARAALQASSTALARNRALVDQGFVAATRLDELAAARERDAARVKELEADRAFADQAARSDEIAAALAEARGAEADAALARWRIGEKQRSAPADALVYDVIHRAGEWVPAGAPVVALLPPGALKLCFFVPQAALARLQVGQDVAVSCDGCPPGLSARVRFIAPQAEFTPPVIYSNESRSKLVFRVEATPHDATALKPGQPVDVRLQPARSAS
jgi:HlyD family secretion protein